MEETISLRIVQTAHQLFTSRGYRNVTIQDIASELGMSKKTIYLYFASKEEIAEAVIKKTLQQISGHIDSNAATSGDPIMILRQTLEQIKDEVVHLGPLFLSDVQKSVPELWNQIVHFRMEKAKFVGQLIAAGKEKGLVKESVHPQWATVLFLESLQACIRPDVSARHGIAMNELMDTFFRVFIDGILEPIYASEQ
ncbi:TetR/AcrR family transcriptional regulator [Paenibacillus alkalitolerans]|uniref:TetR/AcrR family transcriptional regulator n=1 Tax=Paenibacillus alkalitolerans TaxID=2799335 RepID=UPI0018F37AE6|nr:TetR/AcrR family transcriptional regulator [Paenibacillus alkalitolerans]